MPSGLGLISSTYWDSQVGIRHTHGTQIYMLAKTHTHIKAFKTLKIKYDIDVKT